MDAKDTTNEQAIWAREIMIRFTAKTLDEQRSIIKAFDRLFEEVDVMDYQTYQREMHGPAGEDEAAR